MGHGVLVTGATGTVGRQLVGRLLAHGVRVRALCRAPERAAALLPGCVEIVRGDLTDSAVLESALRGVDAAFVLLAEDAGQAFARAAHHAPGLRQLVVLSADAPQGPGFDNPLFAKHIHGEARLRATALPLTVLRPGPFASLALQWAPALAAGDVVGVVHPDLAVPVIDPRDIADVAATVLLGPAPSGVRILPLSGPQALDVHARVHVLGEVLGRSLKVARITEGQWVRLAAGRLPETYARQLMEVERYLIERRLPVVASVREITGSAPRSFRTWAQDHVAAFSAPDRATSFEEAS
ncbi:NAD(P)H-binding protein [Streptomyces sp. BPTC-684]|uniref:SDR family oxidoreductase n=1 Tax=Streptomyces sp. BPTC-684 TaxID=3043734 RepID=UPI0024B2595E|nr:NAD(P)H-binding protein [Streptomyces sp. BPTC-684]WHM40048.1 NAD(P)H-binding protein [Streptomyces sp. BPTC-684]